MKYLKFFTVITAITIFGFISADAQKLQVVDTEGMPIAYVAITNENGVLVGTTDVDGILQDAKGTAVLNLSHIAFQDKAVKLSDVVDGRIVMEDVDFNLPDVEVKPKELAYVQTYYRLIYFDDEGPIYYRGGVIDNTYEFAKQKSSSKTRSLSRGSSGLIRFLLSTLAGRYIDRLGKLDERSTYKRIIDAEKRGRLTLSSDTAGRIIVSDSICTLGYIEDDMTTHQRTSSFNVWQYNAHREAAEAAAKGKKEKKKKVDESSQESYYEVYRIDDEGRSRIDDFVMRQLQVSGTHSHSGGNYMILLQAYATDRNYIDKKEYKQLRKENKVDMDIRELKQFEQSHNIPALAPDIQAHIDKLFEKELKK